MRGISFDVHPGEVFGLLGPNGAGKTTTVEILEGLRQRSSGETLVLGCDPGLETRKIKDRIGVCLQATNLPDKIKVREALDLFASFYSRSVDCTQLLDRLPATYNAARLLGAGNRLGLIKEGYDANLLLVDGNPLKEIERIESIQAVIFKGERISRSELFDQE